MADTTRTFLGITRDGYKIFDRADSHLHYECGLSKELLKKALNMMYANGTRYKKKEIHFKKPIGFTHCVKTTPKDEIVMVHRKGRFGLTPMVFNREPEPCNILTVIIRKDDDSNDYTLITCYVGGGSTREPWDKAIRSDEERKMCEEFWSTHALIYDADKVDWERM